MMVRLYEEAWRSPGRRYNPGFRLCCDPRNQSQAPLLLSYPLPAGLSTVGRSRERHRASDGPFRNELNLWDECHLPRRRR